MLGKLRAGCAVAALSVVASGAMAQDRNDGELVADEILVFGEKTVTNLQDTRTGVQVFTGDEIERSSIRDIDDVFDQSSNVSARFGGEGFAIRGIQNANVAGGGASPLATLYVDGAPFNGFALRTGIEELCDAESVEIFKGPQSTSFGRNALAGTVFIKTRDPEYDHTVKGSIQGGTQESRGGCLTVNTNIIDGVLATRFTADYNYTDGFYNNPTLGLDRQAFNENQSLRGKVLFEPTDWFSNVLTLTYSNNKSGDDEADEATGVFNRNHFGNIQGGEDTETVIAALDSTIDLNDNWYIKNVFTYNSANHDRLDDDNATFAALQAGTNDPGNTDSFFRANITKTFTEEIRLHYESDDLRGHIGGYYSFIDNDDVSGGSGGVPVSFAESFLNGALGPGLGGVLLPAYSNLTNVRDRIFDTETTNLAIFGEVEYDVSSFVTVYGGIRYDRENFKSDGSEVRTVAGLPQTATSAECQLAQFLAFGTDVCAGVNAAVLADAAAAQPPQVDTTSDAFLPMIGATLNWTDDLSTSFTVKRGYRAGGAGSSFITSTNFEFDPEFVWNYELGVRSQWFDDRLTANANVFFLTWRDQQVVVPNPANNNANDGITVNAGESRTYGAELDLYAQPIDGLTLRGSIGYQQTEFTEFVSGGIDFSGNEFPNAPAFTLAAAAEYEFDNGFYVQMDANYRSEAFTDAENRAGSIEDARTLVNGRIGYRTDMIDAHVFATNLFDVDYIEHSSALTDTAKVGDGLFVGARVTVEFGIDDLAQ
ncbi:MAG: TonB-dependent receptor [Pseudomonadota bacterium]